MLLGELDYCHGAWHLVILWGWGVVVLAPYSPMVGVVHGLLPITGVVVLLLLLLLLNLLVLGRSWKLLVMLLHRRLGLLLLLWWRGRVVGWLLLV